MTEPSKDSSSNLRPLLLFLGLAAAAAALALLFVGGEADTDPKSGKETPAAAASADASPAKTPRRTTAARTRASGRVQTDGDTGVAGALVVLTPLEGERDEDSEPPHAVTGSDGTWTLEDVPAGRYALGATAAGYLPGRTPEVVLQASADNAGLDLTLTAGGQKLYGTVADITGGQVEGALVTVQPAEGLTSFNAKAGFVTRTGADGQYAIHLPNGRYSVGVRHLDYTPRGTYLEIAGGDAQRDFELTPMAVIEGSVVRADDGQPVPGALVRVSMEKTLGLPGGQSTTSMEGLKTVEADDAGHFRIRGLQPSTFQLLGAAPDLGSAEPVTVSVGIAEQVQGVELRLGPAHTVKGRVHVVGDPETPVPGARVQVMRPGAAEAGAESDDEGRFALHGLSEGSATLIAMADGYMPQIPGQTISVSDDTEEVVIALDPGQAIRGRVEPATTAEVRIELQPAKMGFGMGGAMMMLGSGGSTVSSPDGEFVIAPVQPGSLSLTAQAEDGRAGTVSLSVGEDGANDVVIQLEERGRYAGTVLDAKGKPVTDATVSLSRKQAMKMTVIVNGRNLSSNSAPTREDGSFEVLGLDEGTYQVSVTAPGMGTLAWANPVDPERPESPIEISLAAQEKRSSEVLTVETRDGVIEGRVTTADGAPAADVWVTPQLQEQLPVPKDEPEEETRSETMMVMATSSGSEGADPFATLPPVLTDEEGRFRVAGLRDGAYTLVAEGPGGAGRTKTPDVRPGSNVSITLAELAAVKGKVEGHGMKVDGASVSVSGPVQRTAVVKNGRFEIDRLDPGKYSLTVRSPDGSKTEAFEVEAGKTAEVDVVLDAWVKVTGRVVDAEGNPISGAPVMLAGGGSGASAESEESEGEQRMEISISSDGSDPANQTDDDGKFEIKAGTGMRVLLVMGPDSPMPIVIKPIQVGDEDLDVGDVKQGDMPQGAMGMGGGAPE